MIDQNEADDKIIAVLKDDAAYGQYRSVSNVSTATLDRLRHYFLTYKQPPGVPKPTANIVDVYEREEALKVISCSLEDYTERFGALHSLLTEALHAIYHGRGGAS